MNSFQRICRSPAFLVLALILCAAVIAGGVALAPAAPKVWVVIPVLLAVAAVICFFVARSTSKAALQKKKEAENEGVVKADLDHAYAGIAANILAALGGKANVQKASCCATRLRFQLKDGAKVDEKALKSAGASGVIRSTPTACQVILGTQVRFVYEELQKLL
ncbi:MAG: PTS transporter subunit EIIB [Subdoligranulum sp.]